MTDGLKLFIEQNIDLINTSQFDVLYDEAIRARSVLEDTGELTDALLKAGINPLEHLSYVPSLYLADSTLAHITVPSNVEVIRKSGFALSKLKTIDLHDDCELGLNSFYGSDIESIKIPYILNEVPDDCFAYCTKLTSVDLNTVYAINSNAFVGCSSLTDIFIPDDIEYINGDAFEQCPNVVLNIHKKNKYVKEYGEMYNVKVKVI